MKGKAKRKESSSLSIPTSQSGERQSSRDQQENKRLRIEKSMINVFTEHQ